MGDSLFTTYPIVIAAPAQAFYHLVLLPCEESYKLSFSVKDETNIRYYLIEGSHDMVSFDKLSRIYAKGNSSLPRTYNATIHNTDYDYYRIRQIDSLSSSVAATEILIERNERPPLRAGNNERELDASAVMSPVYF